MTCSIQELAEQFNKEPFIHVGEGPGGFPFIRLRHDSGAEAMVHLHGGTVSSWTDADGLEMLFVHPDNDFDPRYPIRYDAINEMKIANGGDWLYDKQIKGISTQLCRRRCIYIPYREAEPTFLSSFTALMPQWHVSTAAVDAGGDCKQSSLSMQLACQDSTIETHFHQMAFWGHSISLC